MATVSTTLPSDGQTIDAADVNTPINAILSEFNGNIDNDNIKSTAAIAGSKIADASITNAKLSTTAGEIGGAWQSWTPSWTNVTVGNGTVTARYTQVGKTVFCRLGFVFGSTSAITGANSFTLPVTSATYTGTNTIQAIGLVRILDASPNAVFEGQVVLASATSTAAFRVWNAGSTYVSNVTPSSTIPMTWTTNDEIYMTFSYEAA